MILKKEKWLLIRSISIAAYSNIGDYAKEQGFYDFEELDMLVNKYEEMDLHINAVMKLYALECLKKASENVTTVHHTNQSKENIIKSVELTKQSINNENNLI